LQFQRHGLRGFLKFGGAIVTSRMLWYLYDNADYMILAKKLGQVPFGLYSFAFNLASTPTNKVQPILAPVLYSSFSMIQDDRPQMRDKYLKIIGFAFTFYAMIYCGMFWVSREFVTIFLGSKWVQIILVLQILLAVQPLRAISAFSSSLIDALGKPAVSAVNTFILLVIMVPSFLLGSRWGMVGVSIMWCLAYPVAFFITMSRNMRVAQIPLKQYFKQLLPGLRLVVIASAVLYLFSVLLSHVPFASESRHQLVSLFGKMALGAISYVLTLLYFDRELIKMAIGFVRHKS
jgi:O-antigen/teichoic acid export membrane protein